MTVELRLAGATVMLDDDGLEQLAEQVAPLLEARAGAPAWIRGANAAAEYLGCSPQRIYDLVGREDGGLEHRHDGSRLMFRPEWLDDVLTRRPG